MTTEGGSPNVRRVRIDPRKVGDGIQEAGPLFQLTVDGRGCGADSCRCSPPNYVTLSDGRTLLTLELTDAEAALVRREGRINLTRLTKEAEA